MTKSRKWNLYLLECEGGKIYTGISPDVEERFRKHKAGTGAIFTRINRPVRILAAKEYPNQSQVACAEAKMKKQSHSYKLIWAEAHAWVKS
ncbi:GIY-YIG nuclease family protein [Thermodesulfobacteriota bacterium]